MENDYKETIEKIKDEIQGLMEMLDFYGFEFNDDGDIVDKKTKKLVFDLGSDEDE